MLSKIDDKYYISVRQLAELGYGYPPTGTKGLVWFGVFDGYDSCYKFYEKKEGWDGIWVSPFVSEVGKKNISDSAFLIEFTPELLEYKRL